MSDSREDFDAFLERDFPSAYRERNKHGTNVWVDFAFSCYLQGVKSANNKSMELIQMLEEKDNGNS